MQSNQAFTSGVEARPGVDALRQCNCRGYAASGIQVSILRSAAADQLRVSNGSVHSPENAAERGKIFFLLGAVWLYIVQPARFNGFRAVLAYRYSGTALIIFVARRYRSPAMVKLTSVFPFHFDSDVCSPALSKFRHVQLPSSA